jgi:hypothetical protein
LIRRGDGAFITPPEKGVDVTFASILSISEKVGDSV